MSLDSAHAHLDDSVRTADLPSISLWNARVGDMLPVNKWTPPCAADVSQLLPAFEVMSLIGRGGMGAVYKARQIASDRLVAIKLLPVEVSSDEGYRRRFQREALAMEHLRHPRITSLYESGKAAGEILYFVMEYVEGTTLHEAVYTKALSHAELRQIMCDVCEGLQHAHQRGVIHRDLKPSNVLIGVDRRAKLADFGTARYRPDGGASYDTTGTLFGTRDYLAPELIENREADGRADIYALGVMLYEVFCLQLPRGHCPPPSELVAVDPRLDLIVKTAMQSKPELRFPTASAMLRDLTKLKLSGETGPVDTHRKARFLLRRAWLPSVFACLAAAASIVVAIAIARRPNNSPSSSVATIGVKSVGSPAPSSPARALSVQPLEIWQDCLASPSKVPQELESAQGGYQLRSSFSPARYVILSPKLGDQAVRVRFFCSDQNPRPAIRLHVRASDDMKEFYGAFRQVEKWQIVHRERDKRIAAFADLPLPTDKLEAEVRTTELRIVGERLTLLLDGEVKFSRIATTLHEGRLAIYLSTGVTIQSAEWADLDRASQTLTAHRFRD